MSFIAKQPNGLICRHSSVTDCVTHFNMTEEEYIEMCAEKAKEEARDIIKNHMRPFDMINTKFIPNNMTKKYFNQMVKKMNKPRESDTYELT